MMIIDEKVLRIFLARYGQDEQLIQGMGECGELIAAIQNYRRAKKFGHRTETLNDVLAEAADVYFMIQQIRALNPEEFDRICHEKYKKVETKLKRGK
jgi:NTP pyrophosphatase (non-canonical NTP hydrolase)